VFAKLRDVAALWWPPTAAIDARTCQVDGQVDTRVKSCRWRLQRDGHEGAAGHNFGRFFRTLPALGTRQQGIGVCGTMSGRRGDIISVI